MAQQKVLLGHVKGDPGNPGAVTEATATVDNQVGEPSVEVQLSGENDAKKINFDFKNLKGEKGEAAGFAEASASIDNQVGEPSVDVQLSGDDPAKTISFDFKNLKGETGNGITSIEKTAGTGTPGTKDTYTIHYSDSEDTTFDVYNGQDGDGVYGIVSKEAPGLCPQLPADEELALTVFLDDTANWSDPTVSTASVDGLALALAKVCVENGTIELTDLPERYQARVKATMEPAAVEVPEMPDLPSTSFSQATITSESTKE